ncbi:hypothetical protein BDV40DRAFT_31324 [Aspergillus tamarii]|uniref:Uncharacterized protein n=1 Tax=Aspergillus tamarii TaxID=41984 RepID=A0A5N6V5Y3_ASPTM|nr:hypothetical protein BDV40DRAFT_31324 [Aspergillus tamarii]
MKADMYSYQPFNMQNILKSLMAVSWAYNQHICLPDAFQNQARILERVADYIFWYCEACNLETNLICFAQICLLINISIYQSLQLGASPKPFWMLEFTLY